ncbi:MAG: nucleotidyltransferase family protein, partial [Candidatus Rokubacteria bacterium]|nr:nucleotidyltransferase family protein [Candidatus Rokubacteria bacterium]
MVSPWTLVVPALRALGGDAAGPGWPPPPQAWPAVLAAADAERLTAAVALAARPLTAVPGDVRTRLDAALARALHGSVLLDRALHDALKLFEGAGVMALPLKGPALADALGLHPAARPSHDLDFLIHEADLARADAALRDAGYRRWADDHSFEFDTAFDGATVYENARGVRVDLHWRLQTAPGYAWDADRAREVWDRRVGATVAGVPAHVLGPEDTLLYLAVHLAAHHAFAGLVWHWDVARLLARAGARLDWDAVVARAHAWRVRGALVGTLRRVEALFECGAPPAAVARLTPRGPRHRVAAMVLRRRPGASVEGLGRLVPLLAIDRGRDVAAVCARALAPPRA